MTKNLIIVSIVVVLASAGLFWKFGMKGNTPKTNLPVACTMEAKICPDGSAVGRTGPSCEFSACPDITSSTEAVVSGSVTLSPTCPVERMPPDPKCAPKPFQSEIKVSSANGNTLVKTVRSGSDGSFSVALPYGNYMLQAVGGNPYPQCSSVTLNVQTSSIKGVDLSCDTGIR